MIQGNPTRLATMDWQPARLTGAERLPQPLNEDRVTPAHSGINIIDKGSGIAVHRLIMASISGQKRVDLSEARHLDELASQGPAGFSL